MVLFGARLIINTIDMLIFRKYMEAFVRQRKSNTDISFIFLIICALLGSLVNHLGITYINFFASIFLFSVYTVQYIASVKTKIMAIVIYVGIIAVTEPIGYIVYIFITRIKAQNEIIDYYFIGLIFEILRLCLVDFFCRMKFGKNFRKVELPKEILYTLLIIPLVSMISCFLLIQITKELINTELVLLCFTIIVTIIISNYLMFSIVQQYVERLKKKHEEEMIQKEIYNKDEYYRDMEVYIDRIQTIKHDMNNKLIALSDSFGIDNGATVHNKIMELLSDISEVQDCVYSNNLVLNTILKIKASKAKRAGIEINIRTLMPRKISVDIGDMGVIYGNLIDNAIESCMRIKSGEKYINFESRFQSGKLAIEITNSKGVKEKLICNTVKKDKSAHGRGIRSINIVSKKYGGSLILEDKGNSFEAKLLLVGIKQLE